MSLFGKKKEGTRVPACCCDGAVPASEATRVKATNACCGRAADGICCVKVLGAGCKTCHEQYEQAKLAMQAMGLSVEVEYITDMPKVMEYGVMSVPAVVVNERVVVQGRLVKAADLEELLRKSGY